ncbi:hypothetical protein M407DRAFT_75531 [Tulasnella calospora MUT 4182]|uniref:N-acetyltransferase domain-containing protein n=1 Tax=Tulasnella calospora MUT 4182 TaxID=1051891 RepID=A0A0C3Q7J8_9AGAM|nr:hypothetical protein M407DRAFT_75531 [Tulasnella calospora MUT 4182]
MLDPIVLPLKSSLDNAPAYLSVHHITLASTPADLEDILYQEFSQEVDRGNTFPQRSPTSKDHFHSYFFAHDVFVAIQTDSPSPGTTLEDVRAGHQWNDCLQGFFYIKPNFLDRSSHICNGGFIVPHAARGKGIGHLLGKSFLHFAPKLGYKASIFNLVYSSNLASLATWYRLGFTRIGVIPKAGRLLQPDGSEAYIDANIIYKSFDEV